MSAAELFATAPRATLGLAAGLFRAVHRWSLRRRCVAQLSALDDRMLKDIGLDRSEILSAAYSGSAGRKPVGRAGKSYD